MALQEINKAVIPSVLRGKQIVKSWTVHDVTTNDEKELVKELGRMRRGRTKSTVILIEER
jgi:hypothetical protein